MPIQAALEPLLDVHSLKRPLDLESIFERKAPLEIEIGFGLGEVLIKKAIEQPEKNFLGIEENWERIYKTLKSIAPHSKNTHPGNRVTNIRIMSLDARVAFSRVIPERSVEHIYCLFPCPWPKKSHMKNRLFSTEFQRLLNSRLKKGSSVRLVTDHKPFADWVEEQTQGPTGFDLATDIIRPQFDTKFEKKWQAQGQDKFYELNFTKQKHIAAGCPVDVRMRSYKIKDFKPEKFEFQDLKEKDLSIIFKRKLYDPEIKEMTVLLTVAEKHLVQHIRVSVVQKQDFWRVLRTDGQKFFPTPGVVRAIKSVYEAARSTST